MLEHDPCSQRGALAHATLDWFPAVLMCPWCAGPRRGLPARNESPLSGDWLRMARLLARCVGSAGPIIAAPGHRLAVIRRHCLW
jgi:hypothetical protein